MDRKMPSVLHESFVVSSCLMHCSAHTALSFDHIHTYSDGWLAEFKRRQLSKSVICTCYHSNRLTDPLLRGMGPMGTCSVRQLTSLGTIWLSRMFWKAFKRRPRNVYGKLMDTCVPPHSRCTSTTVWEFQSPLTSSLVCSISIGMKCECVEATQCGRACVLFSEQLVNTYCHGDQ